MVAFSILFVGLVAFAQPAHAQSCDLAGVEPVTQDLDAVLDGVAPTPEGTGLDKATARSVSWLMDAIEFELDTMLELVDVGHARTAEVIGEVVLGELEDLRELLDLCDQDWATIVSLYTELFDKQTLRSPDRAREVADALLGELGRHGSGTGWADTFDE
jgi:hypothetical protein